MSDNDDPTNVISFARRTGQTGFTLTPTTTMGPVIPPPDNDGDPVPTPYRPRRRSPLDALNALPNPGLTRPLLPTPTPAPDPQPGHVPATFRNEPDDGMAGTPGLGALSMAATLAIAIAALRGTHTVLSTWWENRQARHAETAQLREARFKHALAMQQAGYTAEQAGAKHSATMQGIRDKGAQQRSKTNSKVPSSTEFGRKSLGRSGSGAGSGGASGGRGGGAGRGSGASGTGPKKNGSLFGRGGSASGAGGPGAKGRGKNTSAALGGGAKKPVPKVEPKPKKPGFFVEPKKSPLQGSQGGSKTSLDKQRRKQLGGGNGTGSGGTGLGAALKKDTQKAAADRWKKRQKQGAATPALWGNSQKNQKNAPKNPKNGAGQAGKVNLKKAPGQLGNGTPGAAGNKGAGKQNNAQAGGRTKLAAALKKGAYRAARKRLKQRRQGGTTPPVWTAPKNKKQQAAAAGANTPKVNLKKPKHAGNTPRNAGAANGGQAGRQQQRRQKNRQWWAKARAYAQKKATPRPGRGPGNGGCFPGATPGPGGQGAPAGNSPGNGPAGGAHVPPRGNQQRRSPFENAGQATPTTYTVTSDHVPGSQAKRWEPDALTTGAPALPSKGPAALDAASSKTFPRPGTTRPKEARPMPPAKPDARLVKARKQAARTGHGIIADARHMDAQHATEITLDDAIDDYDDFKNDAFKTHDQCHKLADRAIRLRDILLDFAEELAVKHNLIGALFSRAMARLAESMDLLARMAEEMKTSSLEAAEMSEAAANDLNDAYRPYVTATADGGLSTPSAPIHNEA